MFNTPQKRVPLLTDFQLEEFQKVVQWRSGCPLPDGRYLGYAEDEKPGSWKAGAGRDRRVQALLDHASPANKVILELGSCEGVLSVQLAAICKKVVALEVRPRNITCALIRAYLHGVRNCEFHIADVRDLDQNIGKFDILFHAGVLYHLANPLEHLFRIRTVADTMLLDTHYGQRSDMEATSIDFQGKNYDAYVYNEHGWSDSFSGVEDHSLWLSRESLLSALTEFGFGKVSVLHDEETPAGSRIILIAKRNRRFSWRTISRQIGFR